jgi:hypothetical protein
VRWQNPLHRSVEEKEQLGETVEGSSKDKERGGHQRAVSSEPAEGKYGSRR